MNFLPNSGETGEFGLVDVRESPRGGPEIHSAKAHRCVDKVKAKGHDESSAWAICTASIGKRGVYAKGHGGNANPKSAINEAIEAKRKMPMMDDEDTEAMPDDESGEGEDTGSCDCKKCMRKRMMAEMDAVIEEEEAAAVREVKKCKKGYYQKPMKEKAFSSAPAGEGGRFAACVASGKSKALCAYIGRRKFGNAGMARLSAKGRRAAEALLEEVNHCHGSGKGHPCEGEGGPDKNANPWHLNSYHPSRAAAREDAIKQFGAATPYQNGAGAALMRHHLSHAATQLDQRMEKSALKKGQSHNKYAIAHYLGAIQNIHADVMKGHDVHDAIDKHTNWRLNSALHTAAKRAEAKLAKRRHRESFVHDLPVLEVNHCHGPGKGHPCTGGGVSILRMGQAGRTAVRRLLRRRGKASTRRQSQASYFSSGAPQAYRNTVIDNLILHRH